jgi:15-cis-phytoene synthase
MPVAPDPILRRSYRYCRRVHRRHDPTYYWATRRLAGDVRPAVHAVYAFVRVVDEIVDGPRRPPDPTARRAALDRWEVMLADALRGAGGHAHPVLVALADAGSRHRLPLGELGHYFDSMRKDADPVRIETWCELERYMQGSAGSVGRILAALLGVPAQRRHEFASLALAFQLTNFVRDVREDWDLDRVYLPAEDLHRFGVSVDQIERREHTPGFRRLVALEVERARCFGPAPRPPSWSRRTCGARCTSRAASTWACSTAPSGSTSTCCAGARACRRGSSPVPSGARSGAAPDAPRDAPRRRAQLARRSLEAIGVASSIRQQIPCISLHTHAWPCALGAVRGGEDYAGNGGAEASTGG